MVEFICAGLVELQGTRSTKWNKSNANVAKYAQQENLRGK